jgi:4-amino-4-deoxy-L-arabinose transferase-like glycosyltransferase
VSVSASATLDHVSEGRRPWLLLVLLSLALYLPGIVTLPVVDRDEARFVQASRQMLETGDLVRIRYQSEARNKKPVGIYWLQAAVVAALSSAGSPAVWPYRLVSLAGGTSAVLLLFHFGAQIFDRRTALLGAALTASTLDAVFEAHIATTDAALAATAVAAQGALALAYLAPRRGERLGPGAAACFWLAQAVGILIKGPVVPLLSLLTILALVAVERRGRWLMGLRPLLGIPAMLVLVLPWFVLVERATGGAFLRDAVGHDLLGKVAGGQEAHGALPGYYLALLPVTFWPGSLFLGLGAIWAWRHRRLPATKLLAAWILPFWIVLECVPTKLPHYVLPLYPALALICARAVVAADEEGFMPRPDWWVRGPAVLWSLVTLAVGFGLLAIIWLRGGDLSAEIAGVIAASAGAALVWHLWRGIALAIDVTTPLLSVVVALFVIAPGIAAVLPGLSGVWLSRDATHVIRSYRQAGEPVAAVGYAEPSFVFLNGTQTVLLSDAAVGAYLDRQPSAMVLVADTSDPAFTSAAAARHLHPLALGVVEGTDYSNGHHMRLTIYRIAPT